MSILEEIYEHNRLIQPIRQMRRTRSVISLTNSILRHDSSPAIIAEFKRRSPSGFDNRANREIHGYLKKVAQLDPVGLSIVTEPLYFSGLMSDLLIAHELLTPVLAKDFIDTESMITSSFNSGADAILLIADFLEKERIIYLIKYARKLGMDTLTEFHDPAAMDRIPDIVGNTVGYNRRNLRTMRIEDNTDRILRKISNFRGPKVLESGLNFRDIPREYLESFDAFLIGTSILSASEVVL